MIQVYRHRMADIRASSIYIFYSHSDGVHDRGTSRIAWRDHGAIWGDSRGRTGDAYGLCVRLGEDEIFTPDLHEQMRSLFEYANTYGGKYVMPVMTKEDESLYTVRDLCDAFLKNYSLLQNPDDFTSPPPEEWGFYPEERVTPYVDERSPFPSKYETELQKAYEKYRTRTGYIPRATTTTSIRYDTTNPGVVTAWQRLLDAEIREKP